MVTGSIYWHKSKARSEPPRNFRSRNGTGWSLCFQHEENPGMKKPLRCCTEPGKHSVGSYTQTSVVVFAVLGMEARALHMMGE